MKYLTFYFFAFETNRKKQEKPLLLYWQKGLRRLIMKWLQLLAALPNRLLFSSCALSVIHLSTSKWCWKYEPVLRLKASRALSVLQLNFYNTTLDILVWWFDLRVFPSLVFIIKAMIPASISNVINSRLAQSDNLILFHLSPLLRYLTTAFRCGQGA